MLLLLLPATADSDIRFIQRENGASFSYFISSYLYLHIQYLDASQYEGGEHYILALRFYLTRFFQNPFRCHTTT